MSSLTNKLKFFKYDTVVDKNSTFNIDNALNNNWDNLENSINVLKYNAESTYAINDIVSAVLSNRPVLYISLIDNNIGNALSDTTSWKLINIDNSTIETDLSGKTNVDLDNLSDTGKKVLDGQWVFSSLDITNVRALGNYEYSLSTYLPDDNYNYEVMIKFGAFRDATGNGKCMIGNSQEPEICRVSTTSNGRNGNSTPIIPILTDRKIVMSIADGNFTSTVCEAIAYRRIGTNQ